MKFGLALTSKCEFYYGKQEARNLFLCVGISHLGFHETRRSLSTDRTISIDCLRRVPVANTIHHRVTGRSNGRPVHLARPRDPFFGSRGRIFWVDLFSNFRRAWSRTDTSPQCNRGNAMCPSLALIEFAPATLARSASREIVGKNACIGCPSLAIRAGVAEDIRRKTENHEMVVRQRPGPTIHAKPTKFLNGSRFLHPARDRVRSATLWRTRDRIK